MGLDQHAYWREKDEEPHPEEEWKEFCYWRKHHELQCWMERLWKEKLQNRSLEDEFLDKLSEVEETEFNCVEIELTWEDLGFLESAIKNFSYDEFIKKRSDLKFIEDARGLLTEGKRVFYYSWW